MEDTSKYIPGTSYLVDYAIDHFGAVVTSVENLPKTRPPFPCLTGVYNTSSSYEIDKNRYHGIVAAGVDTLELNFGIAEYQNPEMFRQLNDIKAEAVSARYKGSQGMEVDWFGQIFMLQARGSRGGYEYLLKNGDIELQIMPDARGGKPSPELRVIFRSPYIWRIGDIEAYNEVIEYLNKWAFIEYCKVSRADLCVDKVMTLPELNRMKEVVTLAKGKDMYYGGDYQRGQHKTGYQFGRGGMSARFYDKSYEISVKGHGHILSLWEVNGWDRESPVSRLEFQLRRNGLRHFDANMDFATFHNSKADIWSYGTDRYLRIVNSATATRKERAHPTEYWKDYQDCSSLFGDRQGVLPNKQLNPDWRNLIKQANGCEASAWAILAADVGEAHATHMLERECEHNIPPHIIEAGLARKARFAHMS